MLQLSYFCGIKQNQKNREWFEKKEKIQHILCMDTITSIHVSTYMQRS